MVCVRGLVLCGNLLCLKCEVIGIEVFYLFVDGCNMVD